MTEVIFLLGKTGSGKGTQIKNIVKKTGFEVVNTGELLREKAKEDDFLGLKTKEILDRGGLIPTPLVFLIWMPRLVDFRERNVKGVIFDGNPRKLYEAKMLEELFLMFEWDRVSVFHVDITDEEVYQRLSNRKRSDDNPEDIKTRLAWFQDEVVPVIDNYKNSELFFRINGEQSVDGVWRDIENIIDKNINYK